MTEENPVPDPERQHGIRYLEMGACYATPQLYKFLRCALEPADCREGETFLGHDQDETVMGRCDPNNVKIGRCLRENRCALRATDCEEDNAASNFREDDASCTVQRDKALQWDVDAPAFTTFGSCRDASGELFCVYAPEDCDDPDVPDSSLVYLNPYETEAAGVDCDCGNVHVWSCLTETGRAVCAAQENGCRADYMTRSPLQQRDWRQTKTNSLDCRLCVRKNTPVPTKSPVGVPPTTTTRSPVTAALAAATTAPTVATAVAVAALVQDDDDGDGGGVNGATLAVVAGCVGLVALLTVLGVVYARLFRVLKDGRQQQQSGKTMANPHVHFPGQISITTADDAHSASTHNDDRSRGDGGGTLGQRDEDVL